MGSGNDSGSGGILPHHGNRLKSQDRSRAEVLVTGKERKSHK
jgi:hypothetical protein